MKAYLHCRMKRPAQFILYNFGPCSRRLWTRLLIPGGSRWRGWKCKEQLNLIMPFPTLSIDLCPWIILVVNCWHLLSSIAIFFLLLHLYNYFVMLSLLSLILTYSSVLSFIFIFIILDPQDLYTLEIFSFQGGSDYHNQIPVTRANF